MLMDFEELLKNIKEGKIKLHELESIESPEVSAKARRKFIETETGAKLENMSKYSFPADEVRKNIENFIGVAQVPIGVAGKIKVNNLGEFYIPLATTEAALVASVNRGCSAIRKSGGCNVYVLNNGMTRAPVLRARNTADALNCVKWINDNFELIKNEAESTTRFGKLLEIKKWVVGKNVFLRFVFDTKDAMGMNMATIACRRAVDKIEENTNAKCVSVSGNMCTDKKPSAINLIEGRGKSLVAEVVLKREVVENVLKTTPENIVEVCYRKNMLGSALAGSLGFNAQVGNIIAAVFIATGQDPAHVTEAAMSITTAEMEGKDLYFSVYIPSLDVGTVGGGTKLATQREALQIMNIDNSLAPGENSEKFAKIVAAAVLAGEISLLSAEVAGQLASTHQKLAR